MLVKTAKRKRASTYSKKRVVHWRVWKRGELCNIVMYCMDCRYCRQVPTSHSVYNRILHGLSVYI